MKLLPILLSILSALNGLSQNPKIAVKLAPLSAIDFINFPTIESGIELSLSERWSWYNECGLRYTRGEFEYADTSFISLKGPKIKTELRYYFKEKKKTRPRLEGYYLAVNLFYIHDQHNSMAEYYLRADSSARRVDNFGVKRKVWILNFLCGKQQSFAKKFLFEFYAGLGIRFRNIHTISKEFDNEQDELIQPNDLTIDGAKSRIEIMGGKSIMPNLTLGIRLGYRF